MKDVNSLLDEDKHAPALQAHCFIFTYVYYYIGLCERDPAGRRGLFWLIRHELYGRLQFCVLLYGIETGTVAVVAEVTMTDNAGPGICFAQLSE